MDRRSFLKTTGSAGLITLITPTGIIRAFVPQEAEDLETLFAHPPLSAAPQVFWFWMNGHVSREGITKDLEALKRIGVGGVFNFDAGTGIPKGPVAYGSEAWLALKQHAISEAERLGLYFSLHNCPGWSASGGPWITPELSMQQITWSELYVAGGSTLSINLPLPFSKLNYYRDIAVLAYPSLPSEIPLQQVQPFTATGSVNRKKITGEEEGVSVHPEKKGALAWIGFDFGQPYEVRFVTFLIAAVAGAMDEKKRTSVLLESSDDGKTYTSIATISTGLESELRAGDKFITYDITPTTARYFRFSSAQSRRYSQVRFSGIIRLSHFLEKNGSRFQFGGEITSPLYNINTVEYIHHHSIDHAAIIDISAHMDPQGKLQWSAPPGNWTILRFGHTPTGAVNKAAPEGGTGLECDKFSSKAMDFHLDHMMQQLMPMLQALRAQGHAGIEIDSYEAGPQTWTADFAKEFRARMQYDIISYLPALTGRLLINEHSIPVSENLLWDYRRTQAALIADNYYGCFAEWCRSHNITAYAEPYDKGPFEEMQAGARVDVPMGEYWWGLSSILQGNRAVRRTIRLAASIAHVNGRNLVAAEAFTSEPESGRWQEYPFALKALTDKLFCEGVNRIIIHRFAHQPNVFAAPGMTMGPWGIHFDRTNTWFEKSGGWMEYIARCQALLQQGHAHADLLYFTGEEGNIYTKTDREALYPVPPEGYDCDLINAEVIMQSVRIEKGMILIGDHRYRALVLQQFKSISLPLLTRLHGLVQEGMVLIGDRPQKPSGLQADLDRSGFVSMTTSLWGNINGTTILENRLGKGRVIQSSDMKAVLKILDISADFIYSSRSGDAPILYHHRRSGNTELYFISNQRRTAEELVCSFRINNKQPELWDPVSGTIIPLMVYAINNNHVDLPLQLPPYGSAFILFRAPANDHRVQSISKDGNIILQSKPFIIPRKLYTSMQNNFTIQLQAKPEMNVMMEDSVHMGSEKIPWTDFYAIYPSPGGKIYGKGHACCGLAIGRNGIVVWENEDGNPYKVLTATVSLSGWSHVALVYQNGRPSLYVNGNFIASGKKGKHLIHPGTGHAYLREGASYFNGDLEGLQLIKRPLKENEIRMAEQKRLPAPQAASPVSSIVHEGKTALMVRENGRYQLNRLKGLAGSFTVNDLPKPYQLTGHWTVRFPYGPGAPVQIELPELISLHRHADPGIRFFSGEACYTKTFSLPDQFSFGGHRYFLDLGRVEVLAEIIVNGKNLGRVWTRPYEKDITEALQKGHNEIEVRVTNLWPNRLIGDEQEPATDLYELAGANGFEQLVGSGVEKRIGLPIHQLPSWYVDGKPAPAGKKITFTTWKHYSKEDPLLESGLLGPVFISAYRIQLL